MYKKENKQTLNFWPLNDFFGILSKIIFPFFYIFYFYMVYIYFLNCGNSLLCVKK